MEKHIKEFKDHSGYGEYMNQQPPKPIVSWCLSDDEIHYTNVPPPLSMPYWGSTEVETKGGTRDATLQDRYTYDVFSTDLEWFEKNGFTNPWPGMLLVNGVFVQGVSDQAFERYSNGNEYWFEIQDISSSLLNPLEDTITITIYDYVEVIDSGGDDPVVIKGNTKSANYIPPHRKSITVNVKQYDYEALHPIHINPGLPTEEK
jgi:hypothetical protein